MVSKEYQYRLCEALETGHAFPEFWGKAVVCKRERCLYGNQGCEVDWEGERIEGSSDYLFRNCESIGMMPNREH